MKRITVYLEPDLHRALKLQAAETERSVSDLINQAVRTSLGQDLDDLDTFAERSAEAAFSFELVLRNLNHSFSFVLPIFEQHLSYRLQLSS